MPHLLALAEALWQDQVVEVQYRRWSPRPGEVTRRLEPLGLVLKAGVWYLVAAGGSGARTYRVSSIVALTALPEHFIRPDGFDLGAVWEEHVDRYERAETGEVAVVRLTADGIAALPGVLGPKATRLVLATLEPPGPDGRRAVTMPMESVPHAAWLLLRLGAGAQAVAPPELVRHLTEHVQELARLYPGP